jgi:hypothetical protein
MLNLQCEFKKIPQVTQVHVFVFGGGAARVCDSVSFSLLVETQKPFHEYPWPMASIDVFVIYACMLSS